MKLHLIRHGQTDWNAERRVQGQSESILTPLGKQQAEVLGTDIKPLNITEAYCSSSVRTRETADEIFSRSSVEIKYLDELREIYLGPWEGRLYEEIQVSAPLDFHHFWHEPHLFSAEGAETFLALQQRGLKTLAGICSQAQQEDVAIISHGAIIKSILCHYEGRSLANLWDPPHMQNCSHSILQLDRDANGTIIQYGGKEVSAK